MKKETLEKGNKLLKDIAVLKDHLNMVFTERDKYNDHRGNPIKKDKYTGSFIFKPWFTSDERVLINDFVPFPLDKFLAIYKSNIEEEIRRLEAEFENLKDAES